MWMSGGSAPGKLIRRKAIVRAVVQPLRMDAFPSLLDNLAAGSGLAALTVLLHTGGLILIAALVPPLARRLGLHADDAGRTLSMTAVVLGILALLTVEIWTWATAYAALGVNRDFGDALWFSTSMFSTLGYGGASFDPKWRLLTALEGVNGFLMIGWSTAYLVRASTLHGPFRERHF